MRAFLGGRAIPRNEFALTGSEGGGAVSDTPIVLLLADTEVFTPADYIALGYTNFEAWCVGASGGRGGDATETVKWTVTETQEAMPDDIWADVLEKAEWLDSWRPGYLYAAYLSPSDTPPGPYHHRDTDWYDSYGNHFTGGVGGLYRYWLTPSQKAHWDNPTHLGIVRTYGEPFLLNAPMIGGGGGGGGLHVVSGLLADLPTTVTAEVGQQGADGAIGQAKQATDWDPVRSWTTGDGAGGYGMNEARWNWAHRYPSVHPLLSAPAEGSPGGASSFGDICQASGGKGGKPATQWAGATRSQYAHGGEGGVGGQTAPGGGALGATLSGASGKDGSWDGNIGQGGGGGRGGQEAYQSSTGVNKPQIGATQGGRGSLNFADTSVWGAKGPLGTYFRTVMGYIQNSYNEITSITSSAQALIPLSVNPGSGGGARIPGERKYGSRAAGYSHDGAVLVRLTKID